MQKLASILIIGMFAIGCGGKKAPESTTTTTDPNTSTSSGSGNGTTTTGEGTPCSQEIALVCPDGQIDGCLKTPAEGTTHACVAK